MGQSASSEKSFPTSIKNFHDELLRQARIFTEVASLSYDEFQQHLKSLNLISRCCMDADGKVMVFAVKKGTDSTFLWRDTVYIACIKMDLATKNIESYRLLTLSQFLKVFKSIQTQVTAAQQAFSQSSERTTEGSESSSSSSVSSRGVQSKDVTQPFNHSDALALFEQQVEEAASGFLDIDKLTECCICLDRKPEVVLPCAHSYCLPCLEQWNVGNKTCPICREALDSLDETWVIPDFPDEKEISEDICQSLMKLTSCSSDEQEPTVTSLPNSGSNSYERSG